LKGLGLTVSGVTNCQEASFDKLHPFNIASITILPPLKDPAESFDTIVDRKRSVVTNAMDYYEEFDADMDDYEEDYEDEEYEEEWEEYCSSDFACSSAGCLMCNGDYMMEDEYDYEDEGEYEDADPDDDYDQDTQNECADEGQEDQEKKETEGKGKDKEAHQDQEIIIGSAEKKLQPNQIKVEPTWHPLFRLDDPKVVLLSNDNQKFCIDKRILVLYRQVISVAMMCQLTISEVFQDMFSLPVANQVDQTEPIFIDEKAEILAIMLSDLRDYYSVQDRISGHEDHDLATNYFVARTHDKFQITDVRQVAKHRLNDSLRRDPFAGLAFASRQDDVKLGRKAIKLMSFSKWLKGPRVGSIGFWEKISDVKPSWRLALAELLMPVITVSREKRGSDTVARSHLEAPVYTNMKAIAKNFEPK